MELFFSLGLLFTCRCPNRQRSTVPLDVSWTQIFAPSLWGLTLGLESLGRRQKSSVCYVFVLCNTAAYASHKEANAVWCASSPTALSRAAASSTSLQPTHRHSNCSCAVLNSEQLCALLCCSIEIELRLLPIRCIWAFQLIDELQLPSRAPSIFRRFYAMARDVTCSMKACAHTIFHLSALCSPSLPALGQAMFGLGPDRPWPKHAMANAARCMSLDVLLLSVCTVKHQDFSVRTSYQYRLLSVCPLCMPDILLIHAYCGTRLYQLMSLESDKRSIEPSRLAAACLGKACRVTCDI